MQPQLYLVTLICILLPVAICLKCFVGDNYGGMQWLNGELEYGSGNETKLNEYAYGECNKTYCAKLIAGKTFSAFT